MLIAKFYADCQVLCQLLSFMLNTTPIAGKMPSTKFARENAEK